MTASTDRWADVYRDVHANPELSFAETRTAGIVESHLASMGFEVTPGVGGTGVVGLSRTGPGPTVLARADMDALPVLEATGLPYTRVSTDAAGHLGGTDPADFDGATTIDEMAARSRDLPSNHSPMFAPVIEPTLSTGIGALAAAARKWLQ